ncbi:peptidase S9, prolyl oligopeptidase active site region [Pseudonocardia sp. Ae168_Ps1]|nr:peptidase S9, prolyl oligopeptidase active site region [Pseudonocardia sp. Ae150A_Ps1]OLL79536.1 peptidase S9, prolyl oligopeptidase active site region [Pseudonocardia sp. Ae168_Ps1]OLL86323.1 peptidase S9, prolyl oligopeptidase active site region [Pseudonocardia sp. Ae263_Ps1]OLL93633.1 peptidase S9, prolyl oligopeptidase active site region [Pseudonocardia sp. Ae356_Ps1]
MDTVRTEPTTGPAVPAAEPAAAAAGHHSPVVSPDGTRIAWISDLSGRPRVHIAPLPEHGPVDPAGSTVLVADGEHPDVTTLAWSPDGGRIAVEIAPSGSDRTRVALLDPDGGPPVEIAPAATAVTLGAWAPTGRWLGVTILTDTGDPGSDDYGTGTACLVDVRDGSSVVLGTGQAATVQAISADGRRVVLRTGRRGERGLDLVDLRTGARDRLIGGPGGALTATARFGSAPGTLWVHTDADREHSALLAVALGPAADHRIAPARPVAVRPGADLDVVALDRSGARAALVWNAGGRSELEIADLRGGRPQRLVAPCDVVTTVSFGRDGAELLVAGHGPGIPPHVVRMPVGGGHATALIGGAPVPPVPPRPERVLFPAEDGLRIAGWLHRPVAPNGTGFVWLHGGPESEERPGWAPLLHALVAAGVTVLTPNVRGSSGRGRAFARLDDGELRPSSVGDVRAATRLLAGVPDVGPDRIVVGGRSYGGFLTLAALTRYPDLFAGGVDVCGMSDMVAFYADTEPWIAGPAVTEYGDPRTDAPLLETISPLRETDRIGVPLLVVHGEQDGNVPIGQAVAVHDALDARGAPVELIRIPDEGHEVHDRHTRARLTARIVSWVTGVAERDRIRPS